MVFGKCYTFSTKEYNNSMCTNDHLYFCINIIVLLEIMWNLDVIHFIDFTTNHVIQKIDLKIKFKYYFMEFRRITKKTLLHFYLRHTLHQLSALLWYLESTTYSQPRNMLNSTCVQIQTIITRWVLPITSQFFPLEHYNFKFTTNLAYLKYMIH